MTELDPIASLIKLRAQIGRLLHEIDSISELRTVDMRRHLRLVAERMREMVSTHEMTEACKR